VETISLLICLRLRYPSRVILLRGCQETRVLTNVFGFHTESYRKYGSSSVWRMFTDLFDYLPLAAVIDDKIFCVHGGLSSSLSTVDQIRVLSRFQEPAQESPMTDLLWSDPDLENDGFRHTAKGIGCFFGKSNAKQFLETNKLDSIVRSHQLCIDGYQVIWDSKLTTLWSAPNYVYTCGNVGTMLEIGEDLDRNYNTFLPCPTFCRQKHDPLMIKDLPDYFT